MTLQSKTALEATISTNLADNTEGDITPTLHRAVENNIVDGIWGMVSTQIDDTDSPYTVVMATQNILYADPTNGAITVNLPASSSSTGTWIRIKCNGATNSVTVDADGAELIDDATTYVMGQNDTILLHNDGTQWWILADL